MNIASNRRGALFASDVTLLSQNIDRSAAMVPYVVPKRHAAGTSAPTTRSITARSHRFRPVLRESLAAYGQGGSDLAALASS